MRWRGLQSTTLLDVTRLPIVWAVREYFLEFRNGDSEDGGLVSFRTHNAFNGCHFLPSQRTLGFQFPGDALRLFSREEGLVALSVSKHVFSAEVASHFSVSASPADASCSCRALAWDSDPAHRISSSTTRRCNAKMGLLHRRILFCEANVLSICKARSLAQGL